MVSMTDFPALLRELTAIPGISGHEGAIARHMADRLRAFTPDIHIDPIDNVFARFGGTSGKTVAVLAHLDTVGMMVKKINPDGTLGVVRIGGINLKAAPGTHVVVGDGERRIPGIVGVRSAHLAQPGDEAARTDADLYIDVGGKVDGIEITTPIHYAHNEVRLANGFYSAPYLDDRAGCALLIALAEYLKSNPSEHSVYLIGVVQEETTAVGITHLLSVIRPHAALFVDGSVSYDTPDTRGRGETALGAGVVLSAFLYISGIGGWHAHRGLRNRLKTLSRQLAIPFQQDAVHGLMADSRAAVPLAIPSAVLGIPMRGKHAPLETLHLDDLNAALRLLEAYISQPEIF